MGIPPWVVARTAWAKVRLGSAAIAGICAIGI